MKRSVNLHQQDEASEDDDKEKEETREANVNSSVIEDNGSNERTVNHSDITSTNNKDNDRDETTSQSPKMERLIAAVNQKHFTHKVDSQPLSRVLAFLNTQAKTHGCDLRDPRPWQDLCHALWNVKEFVFLR